MLRLLLDEHISPVVAERLLLRVPAMKVLALKHWGNGKYLSASDDHLLLEASKCGLTLVTYDLNTIGPLLKFLGEHGMEHAGVIFVDNKTIRSNDFGGLVKSLEMLWRSEKESDWSNRILFLSSR